MGPTVFVHFFDWFSDKTTWDESTFVDPLDWQKIGVTGSDRESESFYERQFRYLRSLGVDAVAWEYHLQGDGPATFPPANALAALGKTGLKIAPFHDLEISFQVARGERGTPTLANPGTIHPDRKTADFIANALREYYEAVPPSLRATDALGRPVVFVYGYGFDDSGPDPLRWSTFADQLTSGVRLLAGSSPTFYWTSANSMFAAHLFSHHREHFVPFHFVLDTPQMQYGHEAVTWNFGFDNLGVQKKYGMQRVIRLDPRYIQEMGWLAGATDPALLFIYSWNEPFEGSMLLPTAQWGDTKSRLAKAYLERLRRGIDRPLPKTLLIIDDLDEMWTTRKGDWHLKILSEMLLYPMRRFAPQSDVRLVHEAEMMDLARYEIIIDLSSEKTARLIDRILRAMPRSRVMVFDPLLSAGRQLSEPFASDLSRLNINREISLVGPGRTLFARDDVYLATPCKTCEVKLSARIAVSGQTTPIVVQRSDDVWVNSYSGNEEVLRTAFESLYGRPLGASILYGEALASQRLEYDPRTKLFTRNRLRRSSVNLHWPMPKGVNWFVAPLEVPEKHLRFVFGLDDGAGND